MFKGPEVQEGPCNSFDRERLLERCHKLAKKWQSCLASMSSSPSSVSERLEECHFPPKCRSCEELTETVRVAQSLLDSIDVWRLEQRRGFGAGALPLGGPASGQ